MGCVNSAAPQAKVSPVKPVIDYTDLDLHVRKAPESTRDSIENIYQYLSSASTDPTAMSRLIFVWITEFIGHSADTTPIKPIDVDDILRSKVATSTGYVKLFESLCRRADIPVTNIEGFAKGTNHSPDNPYTLTSTPNHTWNAVQISGQWYLVDCTWGAGHILRDGQYKHNFDDFYFFTDPQQLIFTHFPLIDSNFETSKRWQLLKKPITLDEFNKRLTPYPEAFKYKVEPVSHKEATFDVKCEEKIAFKISEDETMILMSSLWLLNDNTLVEQSNKTFDTIYNKEYSVRVRPNCVGTFHLRIFGGRIEESGKAVEDLPLLFRYIIKCIEISESDFEYPEVSEKALTHECLLIKPINGKLSRGSSVDFHLKCVHLDELMINNKHIKAQDGEFKDTVNLDGEESTLTIYGSNERSNKFIPLYGFEIV